MVERMMIGIRTLAVLAFLGVLPALALPPVERWLHVQLESDSWTWRGFSPEQRPAAPLNRDISLGVSLHAENAAVPPAGETVGAAVASRVRSELVSLGAERLQLTSPGDVEGEYRFSCEFALAHHPAYRRPFSATASGPHAAMLEVLRQVRAWRRGDEPTTVSDRRPFGVSGRTVLR